VDTKIKTQIPLKRGGGNSYPAEEIMLSQEGTLIFYVPCMASNSTCVTDYSCTKG